MNRAAEQVTIRVLLVEDSPGAAQIIREMLISCVNTQFDVSIAASPDRIDQAFEGGDFDVILFDLSAWHQPTDVESWLVRRPAVTGRACVVLSDSENEDVALRLVQAGAQDFLGKRDLDARLLCRALRYAVERKRLELRLHHANRVVAVLYREIRPVLDGLQQKHDDLVRTISQPQSASPDLHGGELELYLRDQIGDIQRIREILLAQDVLAAGEGTANLAGRQRKLAWDSESGVARLPRILVVDDEESIIKALRRILPKGREVVGSTSAEEARAMLERGEKADVLLVDLLMPGMDGAEFHTWMMENMPNLLPRTAFISGAAFSSELRQHLDGLSTPLFSKPFDRDQIRKFVDRVLAEQGLVP
jgi:CheY-like chemotaxis protein